jgi:hypothetical protein
MDLDAIDPVDLKGDLGQSSGHLGRQPLIDMILVNPVANLARALTDAGMESCAPQHLAFITAEDPIDEIAVQVELASRAAEPFYPVLELLRFLLDPGHPGTQVIAALVDGSFQKRRVGGMPTAEN